MAIKIQPQTFKSSYIKLIALLSSLVYSLLFAIFLRAGVTYIPSLVVFIIFGVAYLITAIVYILIRNVRKDFDCFKTVWFVDIAYFVGGLVYYVGRNFPLLATFYQFQVPCTTTCLQSLRVAQSFLLGATVVFYRFIPFFISKYYQANLAKERQTTEAKLQLVPEWILAAESLTLLVEFDALYTIMVTSFITVPICTVGGPGAWALWVFFVLLFILIVYYTMNIQYYGNSNVNTSCVASNFGAILVFAAFGMYLLASNTIPIACSGADVVVGWIAMKVLVLIVVITAIVLLLVYRCFSKKRQETLLPRALYLYLHSDYNEQNNLPMESITSDENKKTSP